MAIKNIILQQVISGALVDLYPQTNVLQVMTEDGSKTLATVLSEILASVDAKQTAEQVQTTVDNAIAALVDGAPDALNTLNELAAALQDDANFASTVTNELAKKVDKEEGKGLSSEDFTAELKAKLDSLSNYVHATYTSHETGLYKVSVDGEGHVSGASAVTKEDITNLGIPAQDTTYEPATGEVPGLMSAADKKKLDGIGENAQQYAHPTHTPHESGLYKVTVDEQGHVSEATAVVKEDITGLGIPAQDTTYEKASASADGLMAKEDKARFDAMPSIYTSTPETLVEGDIIIKDITSSN